ncbi:MAG: hypothetical protein EBZ78_09890 [Verrucomicrobia bacterium]|nr:hypothetical protein [Verrucomicrobiota bacterium]
MPGHRFYNPELSSGKLSPEESHHAVDVLRLRTGDSAAVFDGRGTEARVRLTLASSDEVTYQTLSTRTGMDSYVSTGLHHYFSTHRLLWQSLCNKRRGFRKTSTHSFSRTGKNAYPTVYSSSNGGILFFSCLVHFGNQP